MLDQQVICKLLCCSNDMLKLLHAKCAGKTVFCQHSASAHDIAGTKVAMLGVSSTAQNTVQNAVTTMLHECTVQRTFVIG